MRALVWPALIIPWCTNTLCLILTVLLKRSVVAFSRSGVPSKQYSSPSLGGGDLKYQTLLRISTLGFCVRVCVLTTYFHGSLCSRVRKVEFGPKSRTFKNCNICLCACVLTTFIFSSSEMSRQPAFVVGLGRPNVLRLHCKSAAVFIQSVFVVRQGRESMLRLVNGRPRMLRLYCAWYRFPSCSVCVSSDWKNTADGIFC